MTLDNLILYLYISSQSLVFCSSGIAFIVRHLSCDTMAPKQKERRRPAVAKSVSTLYDAEVDEQEVEAARQLLTKSSAGEKKVKMACLVQFCAT